MLRNVGKVATVASANNAVSFQQSRNMATLKDISIRLKSVKNIQKITATMKMVSAAKFNKCQRELPPAIAYGIGSKSFYENSDLATPPEGQVKDKNNHLLIAITSDRGLCGSAHSSVSKSIIRKKKEEGLDNAKIICVGDKARTVISRQFAKDILCHITEVGRLPPTFNDARVIAEAIINSGIEFKQGDIIFNKFKTVVSFKTTDLPFYAQETVNASEKVLIYDSVDGTVLKEYLEYSLASLIYFALKESNASEQSARMTAMDSATKNASDMISKLTIYYNRTRQSVITTELIEIISGAIALEG